jgi:hypothetical protein
VGEPEQIRNELLKAVNLKEGDQGRGPLRVRYPAMSLVALVQGSFFIATGLWPLVHMESFQWVTGRKTDLWLVKTTGVLLAVIGSGLTLAATANQITVPLAIIGMASAAGLIAIELVYVFKRVISGIYLVDSTIEAGFLLWWAVWFRAAAAVH